MGVNPVWLHSPEVEGRRKLAAALAMAFKGKVHSAETRAKVSASRIGIVFSDETRARMSAARKRYCAALAVQTNPNGS